MEIKNLTYSYPSTKQKALDNISYDFSNTGLYYLVGESGSGKSTFINCILGVLGSYQGSINYEGKEIKEMDEKERLNYLHYDISIAQQKDLFEENLPVLDNLMTSLAIYDLSRSQKLVRIQKVLTELGMMDLIDKKINQLSGGEMKRINLVRSLIKDYHVLLLDEPLGPLDEQMRERFTSYFEKISKEKLVIIITHNCKDIKEHTAVLTFKDGKISKIRKGKQSGKRNVEELKTGVRKVSFAINLKHAISCLIKKGRHATFTMFATSLALSSLGMIVLLTSGVSSSLTSYLNSSFSDNSVLIKKRNTEVINPYYSSADYPRLLSVERKYQEEVLGIGAYYDINFENMFKNENRVFFENENRQLNIPSLSGRNFVEFTYYKELEEELNLNDFEKDEIGLGLGLSDALSLCSFFHLDLENPHENLDNFFKTSSKFLNLNLSDRSFGYTLKNVFKVKKVISTPRSLIFHTDSLFNEEFVESNMRFSIYTDLSYTPNIQYCVLKAYTLLTKYDKVESFIEKITYDSSFDDLCFFKANSSYQPVYYQNDNIRTQNRLICYNNYLSSLTLGTIENIVSPYKDYISSIMYSDGFYYCSDEGTISGFLHPLYVAKDKPLLNKIADYNYEAQFDLQGFQGSTIIYDKGVVMGDISSTTDNPLTFESYIDEMEISDGRLPESYQEVMISTNLLEELGYNKMNYYLQDLYMCCLKGTNYLVDGYKNDFVDGGVKICGLVESEENVIYQKPYFLQYLSRNQFDLPINDSLVDKCVVTFKSGLDISLVLNHVKETNQDLEFTTPCLDLKKGVEEILSYVSLFLYSFSLFTGLIACFLLIVVMFLFIKEDKEKIHLLYLLGYSKNDISNYYFTMIFLLGAVSFISSSISLFGATYIFSYQLNDIIGGGLELFQKDAYFLILVATLVICFLACIVGERQVFNENPFKIKKEKRNNIKGLKVIKQA